MTPRARSAATEPCEYGYYHQIGCHHHNIPGEPSDAAMIAAYVHLGGDPERPGGPQRTDGTIRLAYTLDAFAAEHVRALLADDETTVDLMVAVGLNWKDPRAQARAVLGVLRRQILGE